ncbi:FixH family protein [Hymenobacter seoulensis]
MVASPPSKRTFWPYAIVLTFVLFASYIGYMVQQAMRTSVDLVSADYYQQELAYQQRMDTEARTAALPAPVQLTYDAATDRLRVQLPEDLVNQPVTGQVHFFRPSDQKRDFTLPLQLTGGGQEFNTSRLQPGYWRVRLDFTAGGQAYFVERNITLAE